MSLSVSETEAARSPRPPQGPENESQKNISASPPFIPLNTAAFSIARRVIAASFAGQLVLAAGLVFLAAKYAATAVDIYTAVAALLVVLGAAGLVARTLRRSFDPLADMAGRANEISVKNWKLNAHSGANIPQELLPLVEAVDAALVRLQTAYRRQRDFTSDAAHELKTSVAIVKSALQLLLQRPRTQREYQIGLEELQEDCARVEGLLGRMLRLARIEQMAEIGNHASHAPVDLAATCGAAVSHIRAMAEERGIQVQLETFGPVSVMGEAEDLELIWTNLLENAVQNSSPDSTVSMRVVRGAGGTVQVSVQDSGPGIAPADLPHIFERFRRGEAAPARSACGFGLGLAICKALAGAYGGKIEASNLPEQGAEFRVSLPISRG